MPEHMSVFLNAERNGDEQSCSVFSFHVDGFSVCQNIK